MREFTKSVFSYSLAISLFSLKQAQNLLAPVQRDESKHPATKAYNAVTKPITDQLDESLRSVFHTLDNIQRGLVSLSFSFFAPSFAGDSGASREIRHAGRSLDPELAVVA